MDAERKRQEAETGEDGFDTKVREMIDRQMAISG